MFRPEPSPARQGWGLAGGSQSLGAGIAGGLPKLLLELKACLPVGFKQFLEAGMEVVIFLLQVVQTGVDLVQHGVDGSVFWKGKDSQGPIFPQGSQAPSPPPLCASLSLKGLQASPYSLSLTITIWKMGVYQKKKGIGEIA